MADHNQSRNLPRNADGRLLAVLDGCEVVYRTRAGKPLCASCADWHFGTTDPVETFTPIAHGPSVCCAGCCKELVPAETDESADDRGREDLDGLVEQAIGHPSFADYLLY